MKTIPKALLPAASLLFLAATIASGQASAATQPLSLRQAVELALGNNLGLQLKQQDRAAAEGEVLASKGKFDSTFSIDLTTSSQYSSRYIDGYDGDQQTATAATALKKQFATGTALEIGWRNDRYDLTDSGLFSSAAYNSGYFLSLSQPLLQGFGRDLQTAQLQAAEKSLAAAVYLVDGAAADLAARVKAAYWELVFARQEKEVKQLSLQLAEKLRQETAVRIEAGRLAAVDIFQPQAEIARREEALIAAERTIGSSEDDLKLLLNSPDWQASVIPQDNPARLDSTLDGEKILAETLSRRPDLQAAELTSAAALLRQQVAKDSTRPQLALTGGLGYGGADTSYGRALENSTSDPQTNWRIGLQLSMPLNNQLAEGNLLQAEAALKKAQLHSELLRQEIHKAVRAALRDVELSRKSMEASSKTSLAAQKHLEAEQSKFTAGRATTFDVLTAQEAYAQALSQEKLAAVGHAKALAEIDRLQGKVSLP